MKKKAKKKKTDIDQNWLLHKKKWHEINYANWAGAKQYLVEITRLQLPNMI